ncbi:hypothetical protein L873DRAFT_1795827 [Choiromyces venosus 120613-1]|uniref:Uncharacterized protein n=1 Tax=Choiromyces venosus 120613-1 TaxID=1336337 RepID=A0A3N4IUN0_9PEZI|nr:hypothetical protein L873DRAFT_1795827 [Choiromyces venosus 120613-1]
MSLQQTYSRFLASPSAEAFSDSPSVHYITTLITLNSTETIMKYLKREPTLIKKRVEKVLSAVETSDRLVLEVETELEFVKNGGNYLPAMDDNFLADQIVTFPIVHFVHFENGLIKQIRIHWDQANVLKQLGVIGRNGRNWPIKDGREQCRLIATSMSGIPASIPSSSNSNGNGIQPTRSRGGSNSSKIDHPTRDPHASLALFTPHESDDEREPIDHPKVSPRSSAKPPSRDLGEILAGEHSHDTGPLPQRARSAFTPGRTFEIGKGESSGASNPAQGKVQRKASIDSKKYEHFEFSDELEVSAPPAQAPISKRSQHGSSWAFEDFVTPEKKPLKIRKDDVRHFGWTEEEDEQPETQPIRNNKNFGSRARQNTETHFTIKDEDTPEPRSKVSATPIPDKRGNVSQFEITDNSPVGSHAARQKEPTASRKAAVRQMNAHWGQHQSDEEEGGFFARFGGETKPMGIRTAGDGMGIRKTTGRSWAYDEQTSEKPQESTIRIAGDGIGTAKAVGRQWQYDDPEAERRERERKDRR